MSRSDAHAHHDPLLHGTECGNRVCKSRLAQGDVITRCHLIPGCCAFTSSELGSVGLKSS